MSQAETPVSDCLSSDGLDAPFPWFGGKRRVASLVWDAFGRVDNYVEPFFGSGAVLLGRPDFRPGMLETVNDADGLIANFWRSIQLSPAETARWADYPVIENDLHARHTWLLAQLPDLPARLEGDPQWHDQQIAGWWVWGIACWIGREFCSGKGPWQSVDGKLVNLGAAGRGVNRNLVHLGDAGRGVNRKLAALYDWFAALAARLANVRVCCGDWSRVCGPAVTFTHGLTAVFLDPPYADASRDPMIYRIDGLDIAGSVRKWAIEVGRRPDMRIALCGYGGEHQMPDDWRAVAWKAHGGYGAGRGGQGDINKHRERIWFSPHCLRGRQMDLFEAGGFSAIEEEAAE